jgi:hypothetical protein
MSVCSCVCMHVCHCIFIETLQMILPIITRVLNQHLPHRHMTLLAWQWTAGWSHSESVTAGFWGLGEEKLEGTHVN